VTPLDIERIEGARRRAGMSVIELSRRVGLSTSVYYRLVRGELHSSSRIEPLYRALGLPVALINRPDPDEQELLDEYRRLKDALPHKAPAILAEVHRWAEKAREIRRTLDEASAAEHSLGKTDSDRDP